MTTKVFTPTELRADFKILRGALEQSHAGIYWFIEKKNLDKKFEAIDATLDKNLTQREFYARLLPLIASLHHGHTQIGDSTNGVGYNLRELDAAGRFLPFDLQLVEKKIYIKNNLSSNSEIKAGSEIVSIGKKTAAEIVDEMLKYVSADGANFTFQRYQLEKFKFHALLDLLYGSKQNFTIEVRAPDEKRIKTYKVSAESPTTIAQKYQQMVGQSIDYFPPAYQFNLTEDLQTAVLTVRSFYEGFGAPQKLNFEQFLKQTFAELKNKKIENLILDLRNNEGGNDDAAILLYTYLANKPFKLGNPTVAVSNRTDYFQFATNLSDELKQFQASPDDFLSRSATGEYILKPEIDAEQYAVYPVQADAFKERLYIIVNGGSFSATNKFIDTAYFYRPNGRSAIFIGEQNGGNTGYGRMTGGQMLNIVLPNTKLSVRFPMLGFTQLNNSTSPKVKIPDYEVIYSAKDIAGKIDREMEFTKQLIRNDKPLQK